MNDALFILRGLDRDGRELFYTGRAGEGWVAAERAQAFTFSSQEQARRRAMRFNEFVQMHGVRFLALEVAR